MDNIYDKPKSIMNADNADKYDIKSNLYIEDPWTIIESYFRSQHLDRLVRHQLE